MKLYLCCDIEGVACLSSWNEALASNTGYPAYARQMSLEVSAVAEGILATGEHQVIIEDSHGDGCNIIPELLPKKAFLLKGMTGQLFGVNSVFDSSFDGLMLIGFHDCAGGTGNPTSHTMVGSSIFSIKVNGKLWGEMEIFATAAAYCGVPCIFISGDNGVCRSSVQALPGAIVVPTKTGIGYSVLSQTPQAVLEILRNQAVAAVERCKHILPMVLPNSFHVEITYIHHYDAHRNSNYPSAKLSDSNTICFDSDDYADIMRFFHFVL